MCHTTLQHYIHCRHTNITFHHCHVDIDPWHPRASPTSTHPNYAPPPTSSHATTTTRPASASPLDHDPADWRSHDTLQGVAHAYRRKCPACVKDEIRALVRREKTERWRQGEVHALAAWRAFADDPGGTPRRGGAGISGAGGGDTAESNADRSSQLHSQTRTQTQTRRIDWAADRLGDVEQRALAAWQQYAERGSVEEERRLMRDRLRRRRAQGGGEQEASEDADWEMVSTPRPRTGSTWLPLTTAPDDDADRRAWSERTSHDGYGDRALGPRRQPVNQAPPTIVPEIDPQRLGPRVRQRQLDLMEQARLYEMQIWAQRAEDGGLTEQQRALVARGPLLASIPEERRRVVEREVESRDILEEGEILEEPSRRLSSMMGTYGSLGMARGQIDGTDERPSTRVRFVGSQGELESRTPRVVRLTTEDVHSSNGQLLPTTSYGAGFAGEEAEQTDTHDRSESDSFDNNVLMLAEAARAALAYGAATNIDQSTEDMPAVPVERPAGENREAWELVRKMATPLSSSGTAQEETEDSAIGDDEDHDDDESDCATTARVGCPCHEEHEWTTVSSLPTHSHLNMHQQETLAQQRDSPLHSLMPIVAEAEAEELSGDMWEILIASESCGHSLAVFVPRLEYEDASKIHAGCGCYGFDRCLVASRRATSARECLMCRMHRERERWSLLTGKEPTERCPWFERYVRPLEGSRDWALWPFGARDNRPELGQAMR